MVSIKQETQPKKWAKNIKFTKKEIQMAKKYHMKIF